MKIKSIELTNFRNYRSYAFEPNEGLNIITGPNGCGKTNLVEAIYYTSVVKGIKNKKDSDLINENANEFTISCVVENENSTSKLIFYFNKDKNERKVYANNKQITKLSELNKYGNVLLFIPSYTDLFKNSPQDRRDYFNLCISKVSNNYYENSKKYKTLLKERNLALKKEQVDRNLIRSIDKQLVAVSKMIVSYRNAYIQKINAVISSISAQISNKSKKLELIYIPFVKLDHSFENNLLDLYQKNLDKDIKTQTTSIGVHKEDFAMNIEGKDISVFGSQAENRLAMVSLVLSQYFIVKDGAEKPVVILDDVFSELDEENTKKLINLTKNLSQVFITSTETTESQYEKKITEAKQWKKM